MDNNGNVLIHFSKLTDEQKSLLKFNVMKDENAAKHHSFWFKDGKPSQEVGHYYPVCHSFCWLPY